MAGAGKKTFVAGEVLTAAQVNDYLMDQAVMRFSGSAARAASITAPTEGMVTYLDDTNRVEFYNGNRWVTMIDAGVVTTKGDLFVASGSATVTRLVAGGDGQVLTASSGATTGLAWVAAAAGFQVPFDSLASFTTASSWTHPVATAGNPKPVMVHVLGGGGGGGGGGKYSSTYQSHRVTGGAGGAGGNARSMFISVTGSISFVVGAAGVGGLGGSVGTVGGAPGTTGGNTYITNYPLIGFGGGGGLAGQPQINGYNGGAARSYGPFFGGAGGATTIYGASTVLNASPLSLLPVNVRTNLDAPPTAGGGGGGGGRRGNNLIRMDGGTGATGMVGSGGNGGNAAAQGGAGATSGANATGNGGGGGGGGAGAAGAAGNGGNGTVGAVFIYFNSTG